MNIRLRRRAVIAMLAALVWTAPPSVLATDLPLPTIEEWAVPWAATRPRDPYVGPDGQVWFVGQRGHYVAALDPATGAFRRIDLDPGTGPHNVVVGADGTLWYAGNLAAHIGRIHPDHGTIEKIVMPDDDARDPHTLVLDGAGDIWFSVQGGNRLGKLTVADRSVALLAVPTERARPYGIIVAPSGQVWATAFGTNKLLHVDPATMALAEVTLPREEARPRRLEATSDGRIWYVDYAGGRLGFLHPDSGLIKEWLMPGGEDSAPYGMAVDAADRLWMVETGSSPNRLVGFDPVSEAFSTPVPIPSGGGTVRHMTYHAPTDSIWFGTDTNTIGVARLAR